MNKTPAAPGTWRPETPQDREAVLRELQQVLASSHFCNSKRYPALLEYVVEHTLAGNSEMLKERTLGVEVFGRRADYDTSTDTVVRYTASEVRKRLLLYYSDLGHEPHIRISLPPGSYIPEFVPGHDQAQHTVHDPSWGPEHESELDTASSEKAADPVQQQLAQSSSAAPEHPRQSRRKTLIRLAWTIAALAGIAGAWLVYRALLPESPLNAFWAPVLKGQNTVLVCTGSVVFAGRPNYSGTTTAGRDIDYTFVSMQIASAINQVRGTVDRSGDATELLPSASTPVTVFREHSLVLLGGYNNQWTMRLLEPLPFHFLPSNGEAIVDSAHPQRQWSRDQALPYSSADDYAIVARFRDPTIDGWVVALAGLGRNGTEAASSFASSPHYMQLLRNRIGPGFSSKNIEAVLKVNVIDGKTGAPSIVAVHAW